MPLYEYECQACKHQFEALILPGIEAACPKCRSKRLERMLSRFAVSSEQTRQLNLKSARKRAAGIRKEKQVEQAKYEERVIKEERGG
jgi:putative FmdB family regulatory protein